MAAERKKAVAVHYEQRQDHAPRITAKGAGKLAERIIEVARENGISIHHDESLLQGLFALELNSEIPPRLYEAMAAVLAYVYEMQQSYSNHGAAESQ